MKRLLKFVMETYNPELQESSVDFPQPGLSPDVWQKTEQGWEIRPEAEKKIYDVLKMYPHLDLVELADEIHVIGSIGTNQWTDESDVDVHLTIKKELPADKSYEDWQKDIKKWFKDNRDARNMYIGKHPIEVYYQLNPAQEMMAEALYDLKNHKWIKGPMIVPQDFDPYRVYKEALEMAQEIAGDTDLLLGDLKRDVIDYKIFKEAMTKVSPEVRKTLRDKLVAKVQEIEAGIDELLKTKKEWIQMRQDASKPTTPEQALNDIELVKKWNNINALFKFLSRYQYIKLITDLEKMVEDDILSDAEIKRIGDLLGVTNNTSLKKT